MKVEFNSVSVKLGSALICNGVNLTAEQHQVTGVIGPNGSGKSTLLRTVYRMLKPESGWVSVGDDEVWSLSPRESAQRTAIVVQEPRSDFDFTVAEVVQMGRAPHKSSFARETIEDEEIVHTCLEQVGMLQFAVRPFHTLSGGEKQRVLIARALAQRAKVLVLDEPTNHLDIRYQLEILELVRQLNVTTLLAIHDLNLAASYCDSVVVMRNGEAVAAGPPADVLASDLLSDVFGVAVDVRTTPGESPVFTFAPLVRGAGQAVR